MQTIKKDGLNIAIIVVSFLIGVWIGSSLLHLLENYQYFGVSKKISIQFDPFQIVTAIINIILVVYILRRLTKNDEFKKTEITLLVEYFTNFREEFEKAIRDIIAMDSVKYIVVTSKMKNYRVGMNMLINLAESRDVITKNSIPAADLKGHCYDILELLTYTPSEDKSTLGDNSIANGEIQFNQEKIDKISAILYKMQKSTFDLIIEINSSI